MSKNEVALASAIESRTRGICIDLIRENPALTVGELQELCRGEVGTFLSTITLGELSSGTPASSAAKPPTARKQAKASVPAKAKPARAKPAAGASTPDAERPVADTTVDTRTPAGRQVFDEAVFAAIQSIGTPAGASEIQRRTGGTNMQVRSACNRLIEADRLSWSGKARGTRYFVA